MPPGAPFRHPPDHRQPPPEDVPVTRLEKVELWDSVADGYATAAMEFFEGFSEAALRIAPVENGDQVADIACGPGTLSLIAAARGAAVSAVDFSPRMLAQLEDRAERDGLSNLSAYCADGQHLPFEDEVFDASFSMFGLMFFPDRMRGYSEVVRTLKPGAPACISSWAPVSQSPLFRVMWGAFQCVNPDIADPVDDLASLENPDVLRAEMAQAGFRGVLVHPVTVEAEYPSAQAMWEGMAKGSAPIAAMKAAMPEGEWHRRSRPAIDHIEASAGPFPARLGAKAFIAVGRK